MRRLLGSAFAALAAVLVFVTPAFAQSKVALVIGAESYGDAFGPAAGARADAQHVAAALESAGFKVRTLNDPAAGPLESAVFWLGEEVSLGGPGSTAVFYFAGHSAQVDNRSYLMGVDAAAATALSIASEGFPADRIASQLERAGAETSFVVIDASSPNAAARRLSLKPGMASFDAPGGTCIIFSANAGEAGPARRDGVSDFAKAFSNMVAADDERFADRLQAFRQEVASASLGRQSVWYKGMPADDFRFDTPVAAAPGEEAPTRGVGSVRRDLPTIALPPPPAPPPSPAPGSPGPSADEGGFTSGEVETRSLAMTAAQIHEVEVFFGTDRKLENLSGKLQFTYNRADQINYGVATVTIPPVHVRGQVERPTWWKMEFSEDPEKHVILKSFTVETEDDFFERVRGVVAESDGKEAFVFVHGFNTTFDSAAMRTAQLHHDLGFDGAPMFYSWPSRGRPQSYVRDGTAVEQTIPRLERFLTLVAERTGAERVHIIAHSMGNRAVVRALERVAQNMSSGAEAPFDQVILSAPDVDREVFQEMVGRILPSAQRVTLYASQNDAALKAAREVNGFPRAGDTAGGPLVVRGLNTIDASEVRTEMFDIGHDYYAGDHDILEDLRKLVETGADPDARALPRRQLNPDAVYWLIQAPN